MGAGLKQGLECVPEGHTVQIQKVTTYTAVQ